MGKKIVVSFPDGRGVEIPLLYFGAKHYEDMGYEKVFISNPSFGEVDDAFLEILFTPIEGTLEFIKAENDILLVAIGTKDWGMDAGKLKALCDSENIYCHIEENVGQRMEVMNDLKRNLEIVYNAIGQLT